jgi:hypothetical protein
MKDITLSRLVKDLSALIGSILPVAQLFFYQWTYAFDKVFLAKDKFVGISIITLIVSYVLIVAYLSNPYYELYLPNQQKKRKKMEEYWSKYNLIQYQINSLLNNPNPDEKKAIDLANRQVKLERPPAPLKIYQDNQVKVIVTIVILSAIIFVSGSFLNSENSLFQAIQAVSYILLVAFAAIMLTIYKKISDNSNHWKHNKKTRIDKAIKLAVDANGFTQLPQVTFIKQSEVIGSSEFTVTVEYNEDKFEITTDSEAEHLISITKLQVAS